MSNFLQRWSGTIATYPGQLRVVPVELPADATAVGVGPALGNLYSLLICRSLLASTYKTHAAAATLPTIDLQRVATDCALLMRVRDTNWHSDLVLLSDSERALCGDAKVGG